MSARAAGPPVILCEGVARTFATPEGPVAALEHVTLAVHQGEFLALVGPSGCGKTTLLRMMAELVQPTAGRVVFPLAGPADSSASHHQSRATLVFQDAGLFPWMTVVENVAFALKARGMPREERAGAAKRFVAQVGLADFARAYPHQLSGGMRQRAALARALAAEPQALLLDEPFGALDAQSRLVLQEELLRLSSASSRPLVYVTHDVAEAVRLADRIAVMTGRPGRLREEIEIPVPRAERMAGKGQQQTQEITWHIWSLIEAEVRRHLAL